MNYENISLIVSVVVPVVIMFVTLVVQIRLNKTNLINENKSHREKLEAYKKYYESQLSIISESARASRMPFLWLDDKSFSSVIENEQTRIRIHFENIGNGLATNIKVEHKTYPEYGSFIEHVCVCKPRKTTEGTIFYIYTDYLFQNALKPGCRSGFEISRIEVKSNEYKNKESKWLEGPCKVEFYITFNDIYGVNYRQQFGFTHDKKKGLFMIDTKEPEVILFSDSN